MIVKLYEAIAKVFRRPQYNYLASQVTNCQIDNPDKLEKQFKEIKLKPGQAVFFWYRKTRCVNHIAIVSDQDKTKLNLFDAKLVHATPPTTKDDNDFSGVGTLTALEFMGNLDATYSRVIVGSPPTASDDELKKAGEIAKELSISKKIDNKVVLYSLPIASYFCYVKWFDFDNHLKLKIGFPYLVSKKETGSITSWMSTYCGDLVGRIYNQAKISDLPKTRFMGHYYFRSSTFYEWIKANDSIKNIVMWNDPTPEKY